MSEFDPDEMDGQYGDALENVHARANHIHGKVEFHIRDRVYLWSLRQARTAADELDADYDFRGAEQLAGILRAAADDLEAGP